MPVGLKPEGWLDSCMGLACGVWGWSADEFWHATPFDVAMVIKGCTKLRAADFSAEDAAELRALLNEKQK